MQQLNKPEKNIFKCLFTRFIFCHQVDRLGVNKWRLREVGYENIFEDNTKKYQTNYLQSRLMWFVECWVSPGQEGLSLGAGGGF